MSLILQRYTKVFAVHDCRKGATYYSECSTNAFRWMDLALTKRFIADPYFQIQMTPVEKTLFLFLYFLCTARTPMAQQRFLQGFIKDSLTQLPIARGTVSNPSKKQKALTDQNGFFRVQVLPGDLLYVSATRYRYDTVRYSVLYQDTVVLFLVPDDVMQAVTVETGYRRYQQDSLQRRAAFEDDAGTKMSAIDNSPKKTFGLTINLDRLFKRKYKDRASQERAFNNQERQAYIDFRFSPQLVSFYTGLKGNSLVRFMQLYSPSYQWLRDHPHREELLDYLSSMLQAYRSSGQ